MLSRPTKQGLDYFPFDVDLMSDRKFRKLKLEYGNKAIMVYIIILTLIYKDKGYYLVYNDDTKEDVLLDIIDCMSGRYQPDLITVEKIITGLAADQLFCSGSLLSGILTSRRIQATYYRAVSDRKTVNIETKYWLLSKSDMQRLGSSNPIFRLLEINEVNHPINEVNHPINPQSKVKETKVKKTKVEGSRKEETFPAAVDKPVDNIKAYQAFEECGFMLNQHIADTIDSFCEIYSVEWVVEAVKRATDHGKKQISYIRGILNSWSYKGVMDDDKSGAGAKGKQKFDYSWLDDDGI